MYQELFEQERKEVRAMLEAERETGVRIGHFYSLMNIATEFLPQGTDRSLEDIWVGYLTHNRVVNRLRAEPELFMEWDIIEGEEHMEQVLREGGAFLTWHYGFVRHNMHAIMAALARKPSEGRLPFYQVVDASQLQRELQLPEWVKLRESCGIELLNSQTNMVATQLFFHLKKGGAFALFLDGQTGYNQDNSPLETDFISSRIQVRSGIFRLLARSRKKVCLMVMSVTDDNRTKITFHEPFEVGEDVEAACNKAYGIFVEAVHERPELWRLWDRHHNNIVRTHESLGTVPSEVRIDWKSDGLFGKPKLGIDLQSGTVYQLQD